MKILILLTLSLSAYCQQCSFNIHEYKEGVKAPLLFDPAQNTIKYPNKIGIIEMYQDEAIVLMCDEFPKFDKLTSVTLYCVNKTIFVDAIKGNKYNIFEIICKTWPKLLTQNMGTCMSNFQLIEVFFQVGNTRIPLYTSCYDPATCLVHYVIHTIKPINNQVQKIDDWDSSLFACNVNLYTKANQIATFERIFPDQNLNYIDLNNKYLARGRKPGLNYLFACQK